MPVRNHGKVVRKLYWQGTLGCSRSAACRRFIEDGFQLASCRSWLIQGLVLPCSAKPDARRISISWKRDDDSDYADDLRDDN